MAEQFKAALTQCGMALCNPVVLGFIAGMLVHKIVL